MSFLNGNCCLKLNYLICGSKEFSMKKKKINLRKKSIGHNVRSNNKIINKNDFSPITLYQEHNINGISLEQQNCLQKLLKSNKNVQRIKNSDYSSSLNSSIDHQSSHRSHLTLNNQMIIKDIILHRNYQNERLGLTLCYGIKSKSITNIYIEQIDKNSIADYQGELQPGDQIIQINNHIVTNRDQAIQLVNQHSTIILQILRFQFLKTNLSTIGSTITEDDSGIILGYNTDFERNYLIKKKSNSLSCLLSNDFSFEEINSRRCSSLNDFKNYSFLNQQRIDYSIKDLINSQNLFQITKDNEKFILKPLPFNYQQNIYQFKKIRRHYREQCLKKELITTDDELNSEFKQGKYWNKQQRKKHFQKSKIFNSTQEDFNLLNRIFLRENQQELNDKPYLAIKYQQQSNIEKNKLNQIIQKYPLYHFKSKSKSTTTTMSNTSTIII